MKKISKTKMLILAIPLCIVFGIGWVMVIRGN